MKKNDFLFFCILFFLFFKYNFLKSYDIIKETKRKEGRKYENFLVKNPIFFADFFPMHQHDVPSSFFCFGRRLDRKF